MTARAVLATTVATTVAAVGVVAAWLVLMAAGSGWVDVRHPNLTEENRHA